MSNQKEGTSLKVSFIAGGMAGIASRTAASPLDRVKILLQTQGNSKTGSLITTQNKYVFRIIYSIYKTEGFKGLYKGNGVNCIRVFPYIATQYVTFGVYKSFILSHSSNNGFANGAPAQLSNFHRLVGGWLAGGMSLLVTYPMDLVRTRLTIQTTMKDAPAAKHSQPGIWRMLVDTYKYEGGVRALYRGLFPTCLGVMPYVALNFQIYEALKYLYITTWGQNNMENFTNTHKLCFGATSGALGQTIIYPFDLLRRRFQILTMKSSKDAGFHYTGVLDALIKIGKHEGFKGYYKGLTANILRVAPSTAVQWWVYEYFVGILT